MNVIKYTPKNTPTRVLGEATLSIYRVDSFVLSKKALLLLQLEPGDRVSVFEQITPGMHPQHEWFIAKDSEGFRAYYRENKTAARFSSRPLAVDILDKNKLAGNAYKVNIATSPVRLEGQTAYCLIMATAKTL